LLAAGSHEASVELLLEGDVDAAAVDSTVLDLLRRRDPSLASRLRIIERWGPSPSPPWVVSATVPAALRAALRAALLAMAHDPRGRSVLPTGLTSRFAAVTDADYDPVWHIARQAQGVQL
jgi:phosphonate transport system substrate-binding protein